MSSKYDRTNTFALFQRQPEGNQPTHGGEVHVKCRHCGEMNDLELAGWCKQSAKGTQYIQGKVNDKRQRQEQQQEPATQPAQGFDDDIPF